MISVAPDNDIIRAAGVVCLRERPGGHTHDEPPGTEVLLIHRTQIRDWSLPKGKLDRGEHVAVAAVREAAEETGFNVVLGMPLKTQRYSIGDRTKEVSYWLARVVGQSAWEPNREVDEVRWVDVGEAAELLSYPRDADLVKSAVKKRRGTSSLIILRHGQAEKRREFARRYESALPDSFRPLSRVGERQAEDLTPVLAAFGVTSSHSSPSVRCRETVLPYCTESGVDIVEEPLLSEEGFNESRKKAMKRVTELLNDPSPMVVCTHRPVLPALFEQLRRDIGGMDIDPELPAGGFVVIHRDFSSGTVKAVAAERHAP